MHMTAFRRKMGDDMSIPIYPAAPRECLKDFGGTLSIKDFRAANKTSTLYNMISSPQIMWEELNCVKTQTKNKAPKKAGTLKRTKPKNISTVLDQLLGQTE